LNKEYLENYQAREEDEYQKLVVKKIEDGSFDILILIY
jgi:hypothetical protein